LELSDRILFETTGKDTIRKNPNLQATSQHKVKA